MNKNLEILLDQMLILENEIEVALHEQKEKVRYVIKGSRVKFEKQIRDTHRELKTKWLQWFTESNFKNFLSMPFIYGMIFPFVLFDVALLFYQQICFRLYGIPLVKRSDYVVIDRYQLSYLNVFEKINCMYCGYGNGIVAYAVEITARTEQYWCPIKHARRVKSRHNYYKNFIDYGDPDQLNQKVKDGRNQLQQKKN